MDTHLFYNPDVVAYDQYYSGQAGGGNIPKFSGQRGFGLGSILRSFIRTIFPIGRSIAKTAFRISKPHLQAAATDLTKEAARSITSKLAGKQSGGRKRKSSHKRKTKNTKKRRKTKKSSKGIKKTIKRKRKISRQARSVLSSIPDIF